MLYLKKTVLFVLLFFYVSTHSYSQSVRTYISEDTLKSGTIFSFTLVLKSDTLYEEVIFPDSSSFNDELLLRERQQFRTGNLTDSLVYELQFFGNSTLELPRIPIKLVEQERIKTVYTKAYSIPFKSVLEGDDLQAKPIKPIFIFPGPWWPYLAGILLLLAVVYFIYRYLKKQKDKPSERQIYTPPSFHNPLTELEKKLHALSHETDKLDTRIEYKRYYIKLGDALRAYLEDLYKIPALESTSGELYRYMDAFGIDERLREVVRIILQEADMVKFAKHKPTSEDAVYAYRQAAKFLETAKKLDQKRIDNMKADHEQKYAELTEQREKL